MKPKYGLFCGDFHCGHRVGLTPPRWQTKSIEGISTKRNKYYLVQQELWNRFKKILSELPPLDFAVFNGDLVDGKGKKSGGTEQITMDMNEQCDMAVQVVDEVRKICKPGYKFIATYGTDYHVCTEGDEWETKVSEKAQFDKIGAHEWLEVNGLVFDIKHHIGSSSNPAGRDSAINKAALWNDLWALEKMQPRADVVIRSHVHYYKFNGDQDKLCMTLPALQGMGSKFGSKVCEGKVSWGVILFEIKDKNDYTWHDFITPILSQKARAIKI